MESLLRWGIENTDPNATPPDPNNVRKIDPAIIDHILGKSDAVLMKEYFEIAQDESKSEDDRVGALEDFEMLIESLDNANNISPLGLWKPLIELLKTTSSNSIRSQVLWIFGTAVQNNPLSKAKFLDEDPIPLILLHLDSSKSYTGATRSKAMYALSSTLKQSARALDDFSKNNGWTILQSKLIDEELSVKRKTAFLIASLLLPVDDPAQTASAGSVPFPSDAPFDTTMLSIAPKARAELESPEREPTILSTIIAQMRDLTADADFRENLAKCLVNYIELGGRLGPRQKEDIKPALSDAEEHHFGLDAKGWGQLNN